LLLDFIIEMSALGTLFLTDAASFDTIGRTKAEEADTVMRNPEKTIGNLIDKQKISFIASISEEGFPNMKAMLAPRKREGIRKFWFSTNTSSMRVAQYRKNPNASIYFYDKRFFRGVMLIGTMEVLEDAASKELMWQKGDTMYYAKGVTDPDYCVLKFTAVKGRYYSNFHSEDFEVTAGSQTQEDMRLESAKDF